MNASTINFHNIEWGKRYFLNINRTKYGPAPTPLQDLGRYVAINLICVVSIMLLMTCCYFSHVCYNYGWKPLMK